MGREKTHFFSQSEFFKFFCESGDVSHRNEMYRKGALSLLKLEYPIK